MSYGTSMAVGGHSGLGEAASIDWANIINTGIATGLDIYTGAQNKAALEAERAYQLKLAKLTAGRSAAQAGDSSGETTSDGIFGMPKNTALIVGGVAAAAVIGFLVLGKRRRR